MIELLIFYILSKKVSTMYGISKTISTEFPVFLTPSIGTIKPALRRLELSGFIKSQKSISKGGRPSTYYSITEQGKVAFKEYLLAPVPENPTQFLSNARIRLYCADYLSMEDLIKLLRMLRLKTEYILSDINKLEEGRDADFYPKVVLDNLNCEYNNFVSLLEGIERACKH